MLVDNIKRSNIKGCSAAYHAGAQDSLMDSVCLLDFVGDWFVLGVIMDSKARCCQLEVELDLVLQPRLCTVCKRAALKIL